MIENTNQSSPYTNSSSNISNRSYISENINWQTSGWWSTNQSNENQQTPDLKSLLQKLVNQTDWNNNNNAKLYAKRYKPR